MSQIVILTGAGVSAESGIRTFRDAGGLWEGHRIEDVATPEAFQAHPSLVHQFYNLRRAALKQCEPNAAHVALADLQRRLPGQVTLITQNVDDLHERAGAVNVLHMHGELLKIRCCHCSHRCRWSDDLTTTTECPECGRLGGLRPDIVWFGEIPFFLDQIEEALQLADMFVAIGTSGLVYPAAGMVHVARSRGIRTIEFNLRRTEASALFSETHQGPATETVSKWVTEF
ncbi:MAG: NAD-dependent deacylase [Planctomycetaceae bacterium]